MRIQDNFLARSISVAVLTFVAASCDSRQPAAPPSTQTATRAALTPDDAAVIKVLAQLLNLKEVEIKPGAALVDLGMDELDLVESIMELEDRYQVSIPDERLVKKGTNLDEALRQLTVHDLTLIVRDCQEHPVPSKSSTMK